MSNEFQYIYLLKEREFIKTNECIYKIGKTKQKNLDRICNYPNGTALIIQIKCKNCDKLEKELIELFKTKYELQKHIGNEYFKGNCYNMIDDIYKACINERLEFNDNENNNEIKDEIKEMEITTYDDFIKYSNIKKIIITNKNNKEGYLTHGNDIWFKIIGINKLTDDNIDKSLLSILKNNSKDDLIYNFDSIIDDILKRCYNKNPEIYKLNLYEYLISNNDINYILNTKTLKIKNCKEDINNMLVVNNYKNISNLYISNEILDNTDTSIINDILSSLLKDKYKIDEFKEICYNIFVEEKKMIMFMDNGTTFNFLSEIINNLMNILNHQNEYSLIYEYSQKLLYTNIFKTNKPKLIFMNCGSVNSNFNNLYSSYITEQYVFLSKYKINNIIVKNICDVKTTDYDYKKYINYISNNKNKINDLFAEKCPDFYNDIKENYIDIFINPKMLLNNLIKWFCS
jgi:hypothetical protein